MALTGNAINGFPLNLVDYAYNAKDVMHQWAGRKSGVFLLDDNLKVEKASGLNVKVKAGYAWLAYGTEYGLSCWMENESQLTLNLGNSINPRIDRICLSWESALTKERPVLRVKEGLPSATPVGIPLSTTEDVLEICLAEIYVNAGATSIDDITITDTRADENLCGVIDDQALSQYLIDLVSEYQTNVNNAITALQNKDANLQEQVSNKANKVHIHSMDDVTGLNDALNGKANSSHTHNISDIGNLQNELNLRVPFNIKVIDKGTLTTYDSKYYLPLPNVLEFYFVKVYKPNVGVCKVYYPQAGRILNVMPPVINSGSPVNGQEAAEISYEEVTNRIFYWRIS